MTLHTRVMITMPIAPRLVFDKARDLIGVTDAHTWRQKREPSQWRANPQLSMEIGQGLPALMWVEYGADGPLMRDKDEIEYDDPESTALYRDPDGWVEVNFDTAYGYTAENGASCGDLHAWLVQTLGAWLDARGAAWRWYDESGEGWRTTNDDLSGLGNPELGRPGSTTPRSGHEDGRRAFGAFALAAISARESR